MQETYPLYVANQARRPNTDLEVTNKFTGEVATRVALADAGLIEEGIANAALAAGPMRAMRPYERQAVLHRQLRQVGPQLAVRAVGALGAEHVRERAQHLRVVHRGRAQSEAWRDRAGDVDVLRPCAVLEQQERALECRRRLVADPRAHAADETTRPFLPEHCREGIR